MKRTFVLTYSLIGLFLLIGCSKKKLSIEENIPVKTIPIKLHTIDRTLVFTGNIEPWKETKFGAQMSGRIEKIYVKEGDKVKKGDILAQLDDTQLTQARIQYQLAKLDYERMKPLLEEGSISQQQFDNIKGRYETAKAAYELTLKNTQLRAPFTGLVTAKWMNEGEVFLLFPGAAGSPAIFTLMQIDPLKLTVNATEKDFPQLKKGMKVDVQVDIYPDTIFTGQISRLDPVINPITRTFGVEVKINNTQKILRPGMFARVTIHVGKEQVLAVPRASLIQQPGTSIFYCFVVENGIARRRDIQRGDTYDKFIEVKSGLNVGEQLVIQGQYRLKDGLKVKVISE